MVELKFEIGVSTFEGMLGWRSENHVCWDPFIHLAISLYSLSSFCPWNCLVYLHRLQEESIISIYFHCSTAVRVIVIVALIEVKIKVCILCNHIDVDR